MNAAGDLPRLHSLLASWRGEVVLERYFNGARATRAANVKSVSKSIISALVGVAIDRGMVPGPETPIRTYFPEIATDKDARKQRITIEDLLTMRSGLESTSNRNYGAWVQSRNWVQHALAKPLFAEPGTEMEYSTGNTHLLSAILTKATGASTWQFAQDSLAKPLGFTLPRWPQDPQGIYFGGNDMLLTPRQMLSFGELYLRRGRSVKGSDPVTLPRQVVPRKWIEQSFVPRGVSPISGNQYRLWLVDARACRTSGVLRVGIRRSIHHPRAGSRSRRGHNLGVNGGGRSAQSPADALRARRGSRHRSSRDSGRRVAG